MVLLVTDKQVSPKSGTLKSPPKGFDTTAISKTYYNLVSTRLTLLLPDCFMHLLYHFLSLTLSRSLALPLSLYGSLSDFPSPAVC